MEARKVSESTVVMTQLVLPSHTNVHGNIFGGVVMSWIDVAAAISAQRHSMSPVVTASIDDLHFIAPIKLGWVVNLIANINYAGKTSMEVGVRVTAENPIEGIKVTAVSAFCTFVALDSRGMPKRVPSLITETPEEVKRQKNAIVRKEHRLARKKAKITSD